LLAFFVFKRSFNPSKEGKFVNMKLNFTAKLQKIYYLKSAKQQKCDSGIICLVIFNHHHIFYIISFVVLLEY